ncbi:hypothetical protein ASPFODRAFT_48879, partial [Aspergillus luchuensis CBS 106.47]
MMGGISALGGTHLLYLSFWCSWTRQKCIYWHQPTSIPDKLDSQPDLWSLLIPSGVSLSLVSLTASCDLRVVTC